MSYWVVKTQHVFGKHNVGVILSKYGNLGNSKSANSAAFTNPAR